MTFHLPSHCLSVTFHRPSHCLFAAFPLPFRCLSLTFHCLALPFLDFSPPFSLPFRDLPPPFSLPFRDLPLPFSLPSRYLPLPFSLPFDFLFRFDPQVVCGLQSSRRLETLPALIEALLQADTASGGLAAEVPAAVPAPQTTSAHNQTLGETSCIPTLYYSSLSENPE